VKTSKIDADLDAIEGATVVDGVIALSAAVLYQNRELSLRA
jgi:hypothetical protein